MSTKSIAFAWPGLPDYAARCLRKVCDDHDGNFDVIATRPSVPIEGMEVSLGKPVHWLDVESKAVSWRELGLDPPDILFLGGHSERFFRLLAAETRHAGGKLVLLSDNNLNSGKFLETINRFRHNLWLRHQFSGVMVPGAAGQQYAQAMGYNADTIVQSLYGADPSVFFGGAPLKSRSEEFIFVGQFVTRKNVLGLADAFLRLTNDHPGWKLRLCGAGPLKSEIPDHPNIIVEDFLQPLQLAEQLRCARCLVLPSFKEHWGVVVHEAALSGCALALSSTVGAAADIADTTNAVIFAPDSGSGMEVALRKIATWEDEQWRHAEQTSRDRARMFGPQPFAAAVNGLIERLTICRT